VLTADEVFVKPAFDRILFDDIVEADEALGAVCGDADGCVAVDGSLIPDEDFERFESKIIFTKDRYHHRASYNYELDVKMNYAQGLI
ncbi:MAG: hypothetical protein HUK15_03100, partial [Bacteroidales bacterium]|nr:hypothetical protein [Bacteroidales bacterium]